MKLAHISNYIIALQLHIRTIIIQHIIEQIQ